MITLYSTNCPRCLVLEKKLTQSGIDFELNTEFDKREMMKKGFATAPLLEVDGEIMKFEEAVKWINNNNKEE